MLNYRLFGLFKCFLTSLLELVRIDPPQSKKSPLFSDKKTETFIKEKPYPDDIIKQGVIIMKRTFNLNKLFRKDREARLKAAFSAIRHDLKGLEYEGKALDAHQEALKQSTNEWVIYLDRENQILRERVAHLERKMDSLSSKKSRKAEDSLSVLEFV